MTPASSDTRIAGSKVKGLNCPGCGAAMNVRGFEHTVTVVCPQCLAILDAKAPNLQILQKFTDKTRVKLLLPLGSRGKWAGTLYEVIGYQKRTIKVDETEYSWSEYLLFNPYKGFRYFTEYNGHWNFVRSLRAIPRTSGGSKPSVEYEGVSYRHFSMAQARTTYVLGEFPWQVRRGEAFTALDYIAPPKILSSESTPSETTWSIGEYVNGKDIWSEFKPPGSPPKPEGIYLNQPSPYGDKSRGLWRLYLTFLLIGLAIVAGAYVTAQNKQVFAERYRFWANAQAESSYVTPVFELSGRPTNVEIETITDLSNNWAYFNFALINQDTGQAYDFGREVSYYFGQDSDGSWTEGSKTDTATLSSIPAGRYYLLVDPELAPGLTSLDYSIRVRHDVPRSAYFWLTAVLLLIPPVVATIRRHSFEARRWQESDYAPVSSDDGDDD